MLYRRSHARRSICRHVRLNAVALESRFAPAGVDVLPLSITAPVMVTVAPLPPSIAPPTCSPAPSNVRTDLFGHAAPTDEEAEADVNVVWNDLNEIP